MFRSLSSLIPDPADLLVLEVEELAGVLLIHLNSSDGSSGDSVVQHGIISHHNFFHAPAFYGKPEYGGKQEEVNRALMEAWAWLQSAALLVEKAGSQGCFFVSRRARKISSQEDFSAYRKASLLPKAQLHPLIANKVYPAFLRGEYDTAVFQAFREVEMSVRDAGRFGHEDYGTDLMRAAFRPAERKGLASTPGPLTDLQLPTAEQEAMANLFAGAIGLYKNPQSHRLVPTHPEDAAEVILFASQLLRIVDRLKLPSEEKGQ
jgi:uncharacterized protein (TIGR02391 family)